MKINLILLIVFLSVTAFGQNGKKKLAVGDEVVSLNGKVIKIKAETSNYSSSMIDLVIYMEFTLSNKGTDDLIFPTKKVSCQAVKFYKSDGEYLGRMSFFQSNDFMKWENLVKTFDKYKPPKSDTTIIKKDKSWKYKSSYGVELLLDKSKKSPIIPYPEKLTFADMKADSPINLQFLCDSKSSELLNKYKGHNLDEFWKTLGNRWGKYGSLITSDIKSAPISFDLTHTNIKKTE